MWESRRVLRSAGKSSSLKSSIASANALACRRRSRQASTSPESTPSNLTQVELAVVEGTAGEFPRFGRPQVGFRFHSGEHGPDDRRPAMQVKLDDILAGETSRRREIQNQCMVEEPPVLRVV
jgi:hypothetical protein